jgi:hypothetical protein
MAGRASDGQPWEEHQPWHVLGYQQTRPHLRLLSLPEGTVGPSPVALNGAATALDSGFRRDGWLVFKPSQEVWGVDASLTGRAFRVGRWWDCVPARNPRTVWLGDPVSPDPTVGPRQDEPTQLAEYDGVRRAVVARRELAPGFGLVAAVDGGLVMWDRGRELVLVPDITDEAQPQIAAHDMIAQHEGVLAICGERRSGQLGLFDVASRAYVPVRCPMAGDWDMFGSFSPDGRWFAIGVREEPAPTDPQAAAASVFEPTWTRLVLVGADGRVILADGRVDNFIPAPVWDADSRWLIFDPPFDKSLFACDTHASRPALVPIVRRRGRPNPLIDVTDLTREARARRL